MTFRARFSTGVPLGILFAGLIVALDAWLVKGVVARHIQPEQISLLTFLACLAALLSLPLLVVLVYQTLSCLTLRYHLDRNGLGVRWLGNALIIPIRDIQRVDRGYEVRSPVVRRRGVRWPGHQRGEGSVPGIGRTLFLATRSLPDQLVVIAPGQAAAISPGDSDGFLKALEARQELGPNRLIEPEFRRAGWLTWPFWTDRTAWLLLGAAAAINLGLFGYLCARYPGLDLQLPLHFNSLGQVDRIGTRAELFSLPIIGLIVVVTNLLLGLLLYRRERAGAYLLWGAATAAQTLFWLATFSIVA
jgi:hypothetical protein